MTRLALALIILCSLAGILYAGKLIPQNKSCIHVESIESSVDDKPMCVFARHDIQSGETIEPKDLELKVATDTSAKYALHSMGVAIKKKARHFIKKDQMLNVWDFEPIPQHDRVSPYTE